MAFKMRYGRQGPPMYDKSFATKYSDDKGLSKYSDTHMSKTIAKAKPDFLDADGDGNKKESMKKAIADAASSGTNEAITEKVSNLTKTPYEKNKYSSHMPKHGSGRTISNADKKRMDVLIEKLNKMSDPIDSNQAKATLKAIKKIDPNFDAETYM